MAMRRNLVKRYRRHLWGGFIGGKLDMRHIDTKFGGSKVVAAPAIFRNRRDAAAEYEDVRRVSIKELAR